MGSFARQIGYSRASTTGSSAAPTAVALSQYGIDPSTLLTPPDDNPQGILGKVGGFFGNVVGDVVEMGQGLTQLAGAGLYDIYQAGADVIDKPLSLLGKEDVDRSYKMDDFAKSLVFDPEKYKSEGLRAAISPGLQQYAEEAYGINPLKGDLLPDMKKVGHSLYHDPLQSALDVLGGATLGGRIAGKSALSAAKAGDRSAGVLKALPGLDRKSDLFDPTGRHKGGVRKTLLEAGEEPSLIETPLPVNPVTRSIRETVHKRFMSQDVENMNPEIKALADDIGKLDPETQILRMNALEPEYREAVRVYNRAKELGVTRLEHRPIAQLRVKLDAAKRLSGWTANTYRLRNEDMKAIVKLFDEVGLGEDQLKAFHRFAQGVQRVRTPGRAKSLDELEQMVSARPPEDKLRQATEQLRTYIDGLDDADEIEAAMTYAEDLSEAAFLSASNDPMQAAIAKLRVEWHPLVHESVERGLLDGYVGVQKRQYGPLLIEDNRALVEKAGQRFSFDDIAGDTDFWKIKRDAFREAGDSAPIYFPHIDPRRMKPSEFTLRRGGNMEKATGRAPYKANNYKLYVQGLYLADDPAEVYARRAAHMRRIIETSKFVEDIAKRYGRRIERMDEINHASERVFNPKGLKQRWRTRAEIDDAVAEFKSQGMSDEQALAEAVREVEDAIDAKNPDVDVTELYAVPKAVAEKLESYGKYQFGDMGRVFWDGPTNAWRTAVLSFSPRWILNNLLGNITFLKMQGGKLSDVLQDWFNPKFRAKVDAFLAQMPDDLRATVQSGLYSSTEIAKQSLGNAGRTTAGAWVESAKRTKAAKGVGKASDKMQHWNSVVETHFRRASVLRAAERQAAELGMKGAAKSFVRSHDKLERLLADGLTEVEAGRLVDEVNYFFNDYRRLSSLERNVVRRFIMPFYSFYRHAAKLTLTYPFRHPERATALRGLTELAKEMEQDASALPDYLQGSQAIGEGAQEGETRFLNARSANPLGGFTDTLRDPTRLFSMTHPIAKGTAEYISGEDTLTGRPFDAPGVASAYGSDDQYKAVYDDAGRIVGTTPTTVRPNVLEMLGRQVPQYGMVRDIVSGFTGPPGINDRYSTGEEKPDKPRSIGQGVGQWLGLSTTDFDVAEYEERELANRRAALTRILRTLGHIPEAPE